MARGPRRQFRLRQPSSSADQIIPAQIPSSTPEQDYFEYRERNVTFDNGAPICDPDYYPTSSTASRRKVKRMKSKALKKEVKNSKASTLCCLPTELLQHMATFLPDVDVLMLTVSCHHLAGVLEKASKKASECGPAREAFAWRYHRYWGGRLVKKEEDMDPSTLGKIFCEFCIDLHPLSAFSTEQLAKPPGTRRCKASVTTFRFCQHRSYTFCELWSMRSKKILQISPETKARLSFGTATRQDVAPRLIHEQYCQRCTQALPLPTGAAPRFAIEYTEELVYGCGFLLLSEWWNEHVSCITFKEALLKVDEPICPHLRTSSDFVYNQLYLFPLVDILNEPEAKCENEKKCQALSQRTYPPHAFKYGHTGFTKCPEDGCDTRFGLRWDRAQDVIELGVHRNLGKLQSIQDQRWLAHAEVI